MYASLPHFYKAEQLLNGIESGLHPNKKNHGIEMKLEIVSDYCTMHISIDIIIHFLLHCDS